MEKPRLKITMQQISPSLPDPSLFAEAIRNAITFIDNNPEATAADIPCSMRDLWCGDECPLPGLREMVEQSEAIAVSPESVSSLIIFANLYLKHYRQEDFADLDNFIRLYDRYRLLFAAIKSGGPKSLLSSDIILFDSENMDTLMDVVDQPAM